MTALVRAAVAGGIGRVHLDDGAHRNALSAAMSDALAAAIDHVLRENAGAIVLSAEPPVFCAGGSLEGLVSRAVPLAETYRGFEALAGAPVPTIAMVNGPAIGAGVNLPLACDVVLTTPQARFDPRFLDVGIHPGGGHLWRLQRRVGSQGAAAMVLCGDVLDGVEAAAAGLAWRCVDPSELEARALALARRAVARPAPLVARTKASLVASATIGDPADAVALELAAQEWSMDQPGFTERVRAIQEHLAGRS